MKEDRRKRLAEMQSEEGRGNDSLIILFIKIPRGCEQSLRNIPHTGSMKQCLEFKRTNIKYLLKNKREKERMDGFKVILF